MKSDMDTAIRVAHSYDDFIVKMKMKGYTVKGETFGEEALKYLSFCALGQKRFTRVSVKNFGEGYTKEEIRKRIKKQITLKGQPAFGKQRSCKDRFLREG